MRGKGVLYLKDISKRRITPAYAGKRLRVRLPSVQVTDHPRLCGEKEYFEENIPQDAGSPPPMRGKAVSAASNLLSARITPAYAGKSRLMQDWDSRK